jgi:hypothetical protein
MASLDLIVRDVELLQLYEIAVGVQQVAVEFEETVPTQIQDLKPWNRAQGLEQHVGVDSV